MTSDIRVLLFFSDLCRYFTDHKKAFIFRHLDLVIIATNIKIKELSMNDFVSGENKQAQKFSLKSETMREKLCFIFTENPS